MGDRIRIAVPPLEDAEPEPEDIPLDIVFEDKDLIVLNKSSGMVVHPAIGHSTGTLVHALLYHCGESLSGINGVKRPGIVHRLDKDTSGLMIVAKNDESHQFLSAQLQDRSLTRLYWAFVVGVPTPLKGVIEAPISRHNHNRLRMGINMRDGKEAITQYLVQKNFKSALSLVECKLLTGRTHQIRVHMESIKHSLLGDVLYGYQPNALSSLMKKGGYPRERIEEIIHFPRQALHAKEIKFIHPRSHKEMHFKRDLPQDLAQLEQQLNL
jgi:23S rRNA pseudouridine1911/1915/1917 synthase